MKVIVAGLSKTGTKSVNAALKELGYNVYDFLENFHYLRAEWDQIMTSGGSTELFYKMYKDVDAVTDAPASFFWEEIHEAFPDAKIIHMTRSTEEEWLCSMKNQVKVQQTNKLFQLLMLLSPSGYSMYNFMLTLGIVCYGSKRFNANKTLLLHTYRRHNSYILQAAPRDKLLIYNVNEGWDPLCNFLGKPVPETPFPHKNVRGDILNEVMKKHPVMKRLKLEMAFVTGGLLLLVGFGSFKLVQTGFIHQAMSCFT